MRSLTDQVILAEELDFRLGHLLVCPGKRQIIAGQTAELLQPRVMQVLVTLAQRRSEVVSRDELMARCWGGFAVSDDAIHRCIGRLRRLAEAHGGFRIETVPRVGYQIIEVKVPLRARRSIALMASGALLGSVLLASGLWYWL